MPSTSILWTACLSLAFVLNGAAIQAKERREATGIKKATKARHAAPPVIEFGHEGGNLRPYKVGIYADGRVEPLRGLPSVTTNGVSAERVKELVRKSGDRTFWSRGSAQKRPALPDFGFVFVRVRTPSGRIIYRHGAQTGPLGELYSELSELVLSKP